jgi:sugar lactone lactonase YvrE
VEATSVALDAPKGLAYDAVGNLYIASLGQNVIRRVDPNGIITTVAGTGGQGFAGDGGLATNAVLNSPEGIAVDAAGNLYIADTHNNRIRKVTASTGIITTIAGTGVADFSGDGGLATAATFSSPQALALDASGNLYIADIGNSRIRKITGATISTVAGTGEQIFSGDGGLATAAGLDSPEGLVVDSSNNLYIADTHNQRVRLVTAATGIITTFAGNGIEDFSGDGGAATAASVARPSGLALDSSGKLYIADTDNNRIRIVTGGIISTLAGTGAQGFGGDTGLASNAILDSPNSIAVFGNSIAFTDSDNSRVRAVAANGTIATVAGLGATGTPTLVLSGTPTIVYGTGTLTATFSNSGLTGTGTVTLLEGTTTRGTATLSGNTATFALSGFSAGTHTLAATYPGDGSNPATASGNFVLKVTPAPLTATANAASVAYGLPIPTLTGTLGSGVRPADTGNVKVAFATTATQGSSVGIYPITASLTGSAAANYTVTTATSAAVTITAAATKTTLVVDTNPAYAGVAIRLTAAVAASTTATTGTPNGSVNFFNGASQIGTSVALTNGVATITTTLTVVGSQQIRAVYVPGTAPQNWTASTSNTLTETILPGTDFSLSAVGASQTVIPGQSASYTINVTPNPTPFTAPITFTVSGLPVGATATFAPASVTPGSSAVSTVMTIKTAQLASLLRTGSGIGVAFTLLLLPLASRSRRHTMTRLTATVLLCLGGLGAASVLTGCGTGNGFFGQAAKDYTLTITGTSTSVTGAPLVHTTTVTLNLQ